MTGAIFIGPSRPAGEPWPEALERLPPAGLGDIYRLAARPEPPTVIGIVDGYFERRPPVRHAEILWALSRGIRVLGAASIGALRAAELAEHGMEGVGAIFGGYRSGSLFGEPLEADDEVAVLHGPAELGYPALTVALVDLRASLAAAVAAGAVTEQERRLLLAGARARHFSKRSHLSAVEALPQPRRAALLTWLAEHDASLKRQDAALLIRRVAQLATEATAPAAVPPFRPTDAWLDFVEWAESGAEAAGQGEMVLALALDPALRERVLRQALLQVLARREATRRGRKGEAVTALLDLYSPMLSKGLAAALDELGARAAVEAGIRRRRAARQRLDAGEHRLAMTTRDLLAWHGRRIGVEPPADLEAYARSLGLSRGEQLVRALAEDYAAQRFGDG